jgi:isocitrate lyase
VYFGGAARPSSLISLGLDVLLQTLIVARTDAEAATFIDNNIDPRDHPFIIGATNECIPSLNEVR